MIRRSLVALSLLPLSALAQTQVPNVFEDGTPATAAEVNENFQYVLENASGGCSATQQDNSVLIECADGTSGVIAGAGTVVVYPEGVTGVVGDYKSGDIVFLDANDVILGSRVSFNVVIDGGYTAVEGVALGGIPEGDFIDVYALQLLNDEVSNVIRAEMIKGNETSQKSIYWPIYFQYVDCQQAPWVDFNSNDLMSDFGSQIATNVLVKGSNKQWYSRASGGQEVLVKSRIDVDDGCVNEQSVMNLSLAAPFSLPEEILNAAYPVRLEQLP